MSGVASGGQGQIWGGRDEFGVLGGDSFGVPGPKMRCQSLALGWQGLAMGYRGALGCQGRIWGVKVWLWCVKAGFGMSGPASGV